MTGLPHKCNECGKRYCPEHQLPENHHCNALRVDDVSDYDGRRFEGGHRGSDGDRQSRTARGGDSDSATATREEPEPLDDITTYGGAKEPATTSSPDLNPDGSLQQTSGETASENDYSLTERAVRSYRLHRYRFRRRFQSQLALLRLLARWIVLAIKALLVTGVLAAAIVVFEIRIPS